MQKAVTLLAFELLHGITLFCWILTMQPLLMLNSFLLQCKQMKGLQKQVGVI